MARYGRLLHSMVLAASLAAAAPAGAAFLSYSAFIAPQAVPFSTSFTVQKFDSHLGTLSGVQLTLRSDITARIDVWSNLAAPETFNNGFASFPVTVSAQSPDNTSVTALAPAAVPVPGSVGLLASALALMGLFTARRAVHAKSAP